MNWLAFSLLAVGLWGLWGFLSKVAALQLPTGAVYLMSITGHLAVIGFLAASGGLAIPWQPAGLAAGLGAGLCMAFGLLYFLKALSAGGTRRRGGAAHGPVSPGHGNLELDGAARGLHPAPPGRGGLGFGGRLAVV